MLVIIIINLAINYNFLFIRVTSLIIFFFFCKSVSKLMSVMTNNFWSLKLVVNERFSYSNCHIFNHSFYITPPRELYYLYRFRNIFTCNLNIIINQMEYGKFLYNSTKWNITWKRIDFLNIMLRQVFLFT